MVSRKVVIDNPLGLHLRQAGMLCEEALLFKSSVKFKYGSVVANAKSVLGVLGACVKNGDEIEIFCEGEDEEKALDAVVKVMQNGLDDN